MRANYEPNQSPNAHIRGNIMVTNRVITNREWSQIVAIAERHISAIRKTNNELASALFTVFVHEHGKLSDRMSDLETAEHKYQTCEWYRRDKHVKYKLNVAFAKRDIDTQKDVVDNCIKALRATATELGG